MTDDVNAARDDEYITFPLLKSPLEERAERAEAERDEAIALVRDLIDGYEDIDSRLRYVTQQIDRPTLAEAQALLERHDSR